MTSLVVHNTASEVFLLSVLRFSPSLAIIARNG